MDFGALMHELGAGKEPSQVGAALMAALSGAYQAEHVDCVLLEFDTAGAHYVFDFASSQELPQEDRTVAGWAVTPELVDRRDVAYQREFPMAPASHGVAAVDRGHLIPHLSGGEFGPNIFRQDRALNRGWSAQGKRYRALEREAAAVPGTLYFGHLLYVDDSAYPSEIEVGLLRGVELYVERFDNRP